MEITKTRGLLLALLSLAMISTAAADGIIIPEPMPPYTNPEYLDVKYHHVDVTIDNQYTETNIDQVFYNPNSWDIEGTYIFPLPEGAMIQAFSMFIDGQKLEGAVLDKEDARETYEDIVRELKDPALLEYVNRNTFKATIYPINAHSDKQVQLNYSEMLSCSDGICEYVYPLNTEKFSRSNLEDVYVKVMIRSDVPILTVYSPSHEIEVKRIDDYNVEATYEEEGVKPDKDFQLFYTLSQSDMDINVLSYQEEDDDGYFLMMLSPKFGIDQEPIPQDVIFVLDTSGSMAGEKIKQAKEALKFCLNNLKDSDSFNIITFSTEVEAYAEGLEEASNANVDSALAFVDDITTLGGTDIHSALIRALSNLSGSERQKVIIFLTDGKPTVGIQDINQILEDVADDNADARLFVFGVGYEVNTQLLDKLSLQNHGVSEYVRPEEDIEVKVGGLYSKVNSPVLSSPELTVEGLLVEDIYPKQLPDVFRGSQILLFGRFNEPGQALITLTGDISGVENGVLFERDFAPDSSNDFIPRLWAGRKIGYLMDEIRLEGEDEELVDEIISLSKKYGIATPYTSFLIVGDEDDELLKQRAYESLDSAFAPTSGEAAVDASQNIGSLKGQDVIGSSSNTINGVSVEYVGTKTFVLKDSVWTDSTYGDQETKKLRFGSDAYFTFVLTNQHLGEYLAVGDNLILCVGDCIEIRSDYEGDEASPGYIAFSAVDSSSSDSGLNCGDNICQAGEDCPSDCELSPISGDITPNTGDDKPVVILGSGNEDDNALFLVLVITSVALIGAIYIIRKR